MKRHSKLAECLFSLGKVLDGIGDGPDKGAEAEAGL